MPGAKCYGLHADGFRDLTPILRRWVRLIRGLASDWGSPDYGRDRDAPWWYNEQASIGFLAASVWRAGGQAIEEYATHKELKRRKRRSLAQGRGDLLIYRDKSYVVEAKQGYRSLDGRSSSLRSYVSTTLKLACKDAVRTPRFGVAQRLGVLFLIPWRVASKGVPTDHDIRRWLAGLNDLNGVAVAWCFPPVARSLKAKDNDGRWYYYPGVMLLMRRPRTLSKHRDKQGQTLRG